MSGPLHIGVALHTVPATHPVGRTFHKAAMVMVAMFHSSDALTMIKAEIGLITQRRYDDGVCAAHEDGADALS